MTIPGGWGGAAQGCAIYIYHYMCIYYIIYVLHIRQMTTPNMKFFLDTLCAGQAEDSLAKLEDVAQWCAGPGS